MPDLSSAPTAEMKMPKMPASNPFSGTLPLKTPTMVIPQRVSMKNSGEPNESTRGRRKGKEASRTIGPMRPPTSEATKDALRARIAWPCFANG